jgi:bifunctional DNase/RNase
MRFSIFSTMTERYRVELKVAGLSRGVSDTDMFILLLREAGSKRMLPLLLCEEEMQTLSMVMNPTTRGRIPLTECVKHMTDVFGIIVEEVEISSVLDGRYTALMTCCQNGLREHVRVTAVDAVVMALVYRCPIYIRATLLERQVPYQQGKDSVVLPIDTLTVELLEEALQRAVKNENYKLASRLRDELIRRR